MPVKILNIGSLNYDMVYSVDHILQAGETIASSNMEIFCGGKGLNQSIALARAGVDVFHAGMVGTDGQNLLNTCQSNGINTKYIKQVSGKSGHAIIQVDKTAQNSILLYGGSNQKLTSEYIGSVLQDFNEGDLILLQNEVNLLPEIVERAFEKGMVIFLNPSPFNSTMQQLDINKISYLLMNEIEGEQLTNEKQPEKILDVMKENFPKTKVVLTLGKNGAFYQDPQQRYYQAIYPVKAIDTTAAGDTFTGYFIACLHKQMEIPEALNVSACASSIAVSKKGATSSIPTFKEVISKMNS